jgi:BTB/POZ domain
MLWKRPREPDAADDATTVNTDLLRGLPALATSACDGDCGGDCGGLADVWVTTSDGESLPAFRALLAASSPALRAMFRHPMKARPATARLSLPFDLVF